MEDDGAPIALLRVEERVRNRNRHFVPKLGRPEGVAVDENVGHGGILFGDEGRRSRQRLQAVDDALQRAQRLMAQWDEELRRELPEGAEIFDAHTHLGTDIDGMVGIYDDLIRGMEKYGISRCFMFCLDEPDRHPGFRAGNDRTLAYASRSDGKLIPFARLDLSEDPIGEATRCLDLDARGIKLHPRAQKFLLNDERLSPIFELAAERNVPVLIHGGRRLPPIADDLARVIDPYPKAQLIVAHAGIADRIAAGEAPREPSAPKGVDVFQQPMALARIHQYLSMATPLLWTRQPDRVGVLGLALNACDDSSNGNRDELEQIRELLMAAQEMWRALTEEGHEKDRMAHTRATFRLIHLADIVAVTTPA